MKTCIWCNQRSGSIEHVEMKLRNFYGFGFHDAILSVHPEHKESAIRIINRYNRYGHLVIFFFIGVLVSTFFLDTTYHTITAIVLGILIFLFPFATPETTDAFGLKWAVIMARSAGLILIALGIYF